ncbi:MAG: efflux RND transporter periplasmic adaptor subunit, partial [bacterium]
MKRILVLLGIALVASGCARAPRTDAVSAAPAATSVSVARAERQEVVERVTLTGTVFPFEQATVYAKTTGYLKRLRVDIGDRVRQGEMLAELDAPELETAIAEKRAAVARAEVGIEQARAAVEQNRAEVTFQEASYKRLKAIHDRDRDLLPENDVDQAHAGYGVAAGKLRSAEASVRAAEAAVDAARAELRTLEILAGYTRIAAPLSGIVTERFVDPGALIQAASSSRTQAAPLVAIARVDRLRVALDIPEPNVAYVALATRAVVEAASLPGEKFSANVARIGMALDSA